MSTVAYGRSSDNVAANATVLASAEDATYPATFLVDLDPAKPAKLTTTTGSWTFTFAAAQRVDAVALIHHNLTAGLEVRVKASADNFATTALNTTITIPAYREDGFPVSPFVDLRAVSGYTTGGYQYWRIHIVGTNAAAVAIGEVVLIATLRSLEVNVAWGLQDSEEHPIVEHVTDFGVVTVYEYGTLLRSFVAMVQDTTDAGAAS